MIYLSDGTFDSLLCALSEALAAKGRHTISSEERFTPVLFGECKTVKTDADTAAIMADKIASNMGRHSLGHIVRCFLSESENMETIILEYVREGLKIGLYINGHLTHPAVDAILKTSRKVSVEAHRFCGILRFEKVSGGRGDGIMYAGYEPDNNITALIAPHFMARLSSEKWMIHDIGRNFAMIHDNGVLSPAEVDLSLLKNMKKETPEADEDKYSELWKSYFKTIAIQERINPKLQKRFMPKRYWKYLTEKTQTL